MKTLKYLLVTLLLAATAAGFVSCSGDDDGNGSSHRSSNLVGTWKADVSDQFPEQKNRLSRFLVGIGI